MRFVSLLACGVLLAASSGCATGAASGDDTSVDSGIPKSDSGTPKTDSGTPKQDSGNPVIDSGGGNCGGSCLGTDNTCCSNTCVDTTSDPNNCGFCTNSCGAQSCCSSSCTDTMGTDVNNCGGCGVTCSGTCTNGVCQMNNGCTIDVSSCSHSPCSTGIALVDGCDDNDEGIVSFVCEFFEPSCCSSTWDSTCTTLAAELEVNSCSGC